MSICPWCKGRVPAATDTCPLCGKHPADHPSIASSGYADFGSFDDLDGPAPETASAGAAPHAPQDLGGFDAFSDDAPPPSGLFEIDGPSRAAPRQLAKPPSGPAAPAAGQGPMPKPASSGPAAPGDSIDPYEIAVLADFGPVPDQLYLTPLYAWRVWNRKSTLRRRHKVAAQAAAEAERLRDDQLAALAERARPRIEKSPEFAELLQPLVDAERTAQDRSVALEQRSAQFGEQTAAIDRQISEAQEKMRAAEAVVDAARRQLAAREDVLKRAQALRKRVEIELRNTQEMARAAAGPQAKTAPPEYASRLAELQADLDQRIGDCAEPQAAYDAALAEVKEAERSLSALDRSARALRSERAKMEQAFSREAGMRSQGVQKAEQSRRVALVGIGSRLVELHAGLVAPEDQQAWGAAQAQLAGRALETEKLLRAMQSADQDAVKKGTALIAVAVALALALLIAFIWAVGSSQPA